jgi:hypothetical protein
LAEVALRDRITFAAGLVAVCVTGFNEGEESAG